MMELLNNIWLALSTPNATLINIISVPAISLEVLFTLLLFLNTFNVTSSKQQRILYVILCSFVGIVTNILLPSPFNIFINYILTFLINFSIFKLSFFKTFIGVIIPTILFALIEGLTLNPYLSAFKITYEQITTIPIHRISYSLITYTFIYITIFFIKHKDFPIYLLDILDKKTKLTIFINVVLALFALVLQAFVTVFYIDVLPLIITFLSFITLLIYVSVSIYSLTKTTKLVLAKQQLESAEEYNKTLKVLHDNVRSFKHDFDNIVTTIGGYVKTNDMDGLKKYYVQLEDDCQKVNNLYLLNPEIINNPGIYNLLTNKYYNADSKGIKVNMSFLLDLNEIKMKIYEFARILGILLDNAIEASEECDEKIINITFRNDDKNHRQLIIIENTYNDKNIDTEKIFGKGITGKENHTGLGLWEVQNIIKKTHNANLYTYKTEKYFVQQLELYY